VCVRVYSVSFEIPRCLPLVSDVYLLLWGRISARIVEMKMMERVCMYMYVVQLRLNESKVAERTNLELFTG
jgi:hypothetical protein